MSRKPEVDSRPSALTSSGKPLYFPTESNLYSVNPCPPVKLFSRKGYNYVDEEDNLYWDVLREPSRTEWANKSCLGDLVSDQSDVLVSAQSKDRLFFVRQNAEARKNKQVFVLPEPASTLKLVAAQPSLEDLLCQVVLTGQSAGGGYATRSVQWLLVRLP